MRVAAVVFVVGVPAGLVNLAVAPAVRAHADIWSVVLLDLGLAGLALALWFLPWPRWSGWTQLLVLPVGAAFTIATERVYGYSAAGAPVDGTVVYVVFVPLWLGFTQRRWSASIAGPLAAMPVIVHDAAMNGFEAVVPALGMLALSVGAAEYLSQVRTREGHLLDHLHDLASLARRLDVTVTDEDLHRHLAERLHEGLRAVEVAVGAVRHPHRMAGRPLPYVAGHCRRLAVRVPHAESILDLAVVLPTPVPSAAQESLALLLREIVGRFLEERADVSRRIRTDPLTGLGNRAAADEAVALLGPGDAVVVVDVDHFKRVNDSAGHASGDEILRQLARFLRAQLRASDLLCRLGGDELLLVLRGTERAEEATRAILERWGTLEPPVTLSAGLAVCGHGEQGRDVLARADAALYAAKAAGRARLCTTS
jgi:diguanylate cyclase (GGDEF)-like protein